MDHVPEASFKSLRVGFHCELMLIIVAWKEGNQSVTVADGRYAVNKPPELQNKVHSLLSKLEKYFHKTTNMNTEYRKTQQCAPMFPVMTNQRRISTDVRDVIAVLNHVYLSAHSCSPIHSFIHLHPHLRVVHVPQQVALLGVQDEVSAQEPAAALILLDVQEAADAILSVHIRHRNPDQLGPPWGITGTLPGGGTGPRLADALIQNNLQQNATAGY